MYHTWFLPEKSSNSSWEGRSCQECPGDSGSPMGSHAIGKKSREKEGGLGQSLGLMGGVGPEVQVIRRQYWDRWRTLGRRCRCHGGTHDKYGAVLLTSFQNGTMGTLHPDSASGISFVLKYASSASSWLLPVCPSSSLRLLPPV